MGRELIWSGFIILTLSGCFNFSHGNIYKTKLKLRMDIIVKCTMYRKIKLQKLSHRIKHDKRSESKKHEDKMEAVGEGFQWKKGVRGN